MSNASAIQSFPSRTIQQTGEFLKREAQELLDVGVALASGDLQTAAAEATELFGLGAHGANAAAAYGFVPNDSFTKDTLSAAINNVVGNRAAAAKDAADLSRAGAPAASIPVLNVPAGSVMASIEALLHDLESVVRALALPSNGAAAETPIAAKSSTSKPKPGTSNAPQSGPAKPDASDAPSAAEGAKSEVPLNDEVSRILSDPSLTFEDMVEQVLGAVIRDSQSDIKRQLQEHSEALRVAQQPKGAKGKGKDDVLAPAQKPGFFEGMLGLAAGAFGDKGLQGILTGILTPLVTGALALVPPVGPMLAPLVPALLPGAISALGDVVDAAATPAVGGAEPAPNNVVDDHDPDDPDETSTKPAKKKPSKAKKDPGDVDAPAPKKEIAKPATRAVKGLDDVETTEEGRALVFERIKQLQSKMSEMEQALSGILSSQHETALAAIRNIR